jgi:hypothetical protein
MENRDISILKDPTKATFPDYVGPLSSKAKYFT